MALTTSEITGRVPMPDDTASKAAEVIFTLSGFDTEGNQVIPGGASRRFVLDADGNLPAGAELWRNTEGMRGTAYRVMVRWVEADRRNRAEDRTNDLGWIQVGDDTSYTLPDLLANPAGPAPGWYETVPNLVWEALVAGLAQIASKADQTALDAEVSARIAGQTANAEAIAAETERATGVEAGLAADIDAETARATGVEAGLQTQINTKAAQSDLLAETTRASGAEAALGVRIDGEEAARATADTAIDGKAASGLSAVQIGAASLTASLVSTTWTLAWTGIRMLVRASAVTVADLASTGLASGEVLYIDLDGGSTPYAVTKATLDAPLRADFAFGRKLMLVRNASGALSGPLSDHARLALVQAGLGSAAGQDASAFATAAQGGKADTAVQPAALDAEASSRASGDAANADAIADETTRSTGVEAELDARIDTKAAQADLDALAAPTTARPIGAMLVDDGGRPLFGWHTRRGLLTATASGLAPARPADMGNLWQGDGWPEYLYLNGLRLPRDIARRLVIIPGYGQSLAGAANDNPADTLFNSVATYPDHALMPAVGPAPGGQYFDRLRPLVDIPGTGFDTRRSHWLSPLANTLIGAMDAAFGVRPRVCMFSASQGGRSWNNLMPGNEAFRFLAKGLQGCVVAARRMGLIPWVPVIFWAQGQQDRSEGLSEERIRRDRQAMLREVTALVRAMTGQPDDPIIFISQPNNSLATDGIIPAHMTAPVSLDGQGNFRLLPPDYDLPMSSTDPDINTGVHPSSAGYQTMGIRWAHALMDEVFGRGYTAVRCTRAWWEDSQTIRLLYQTRTAPLVIDTSGTTVAVPTWPGSLNGWQFFDGSLTPPTIASMSVVDDPDASGTQLTVLRIVLSGPPTGPAPRLHYSTRNDGTGANSGCLTGPRGCIRDSSPTPFWAASQVIHLGRAA